MTYEIEIKSSAQKELTKLPRSIANKVIQNIRELANDPRPSGCKKLVGTE
jgi:mRNA interferase RelE/StbE